jgi:hypothetical protein
MNVQPLRGQTRSVAISFVMTSTDCMPTRSGAAMPMYWLRELGQKRESCGTNSPYYGCFRPTRMIGIMIDVAIQCRRSVADEIRRTMPMHCLRELVRKRESCGTNSPYYRCFRPTRMIGFLPHILRFVRCDQRRFISTSSCYLWYK